MNKKLTIIVPVYNEVNTVEIIIKKLLDLELYNNIDKEIIIIDDLSTDGSREIIKSYDSKYDLIKGIYKDKNNQKSNKSFV